MLLKADGSLVANMRFLCPTRSVGSWQIGRRFSKGCKICLEQRTYVVPNHETECCLKPSIGRLHCTARASDLGAMRTIKHFQLSFFPIRIESIAMSRRQGYLSLLFPAAGGTTLSFLIGYNSRFFVPLLLVAFRYRQ